MKEKNIPLYMEIYEDLKDKIEKEVYKAGSILPPELDLQQQYNVSRITMRRALSDLERDGLIKRTRGKGTVVLPKKKYRDLYSLKGFSEEAKDNDDIPTSIIIKCEEIACPVHVAEFLNVDANDTVYYLARIRLINGRISGFFETYISQKIGLTFDPNTINGNTSLYDFYEKNGIKIGYANETIEAIMAPQEVKRMMFIEEDEPIFYRERVTLDENDVPIEFSRNYYKANGYKYFIRMHR